MAKRATPAARGMEVEMWPVDKPQDYPGNPRIITEAAVEKVAASIERFGWRQPIVVDADGVIVIGHTRLRAARKLGHTHVPVHVATGLSPEEVKALRVADNRTGEEAEWENELLAKELRDLQLSDFDLGHIGFDPSELQVILEGWESDIDELKKEHGEHADGIEVTIKVRVAQADKDAAQAAILEALTGGSIKHEFA